MTKAKHVVPLVVLLGIGAMLTMAVIDMPQFGDPEAPAHHHVASRYIAMAYEETGVPNMVTAVLADYRGYDTLGELTVIFAAGAAVLSLLAGKPKEKESESVSASVSVSVSEEGKG